MRKALEALVRREHQDQLAAATDDERQAEPDTQPNDEQRRQARQARRERQGRVVGGSVMIRPPRLPARRNYGRSFPTRSLMSLPSARPAARD